MHRRLVAGALLGLGWGLAASCARDDREVQLALPIYGADGGPGGSQPTEPGGAGVPQLEVGPTNVDLGWVTVGFPARARLLMVNRGDAAAPAPLVNWSSNVDEAFEIIQNQCTSELLPGAACEVRVQLIPRAPGEKAAVLHVESVGAGGTDVSFTGLGLVAGDLVLAPAPGSFEDFGRALIGSRLEGTFSISNPSATASGPLAFQLNRPEFAVLPSTGDPADCVLGVTSLVDAQSCNLRVAFTPSERGPVETTLTARSEGVGSISLTLAGVGLSPGVLAVSEPTIDFDGVVVGGATQRSVSFENQGDDVLTLAGTSLQPEGLEGFSILTSDCGAGRVLAGGEACTVQVEFRPPRPGEELMGELVTEAGVGQRQAVGLRGIGLEQGTLTVSAVVAGEEDFGPVLLTTDSVRAFRVTNPGSQPSGVLTFAASVGFELVSPPTDGECVAGSTSLLEGESCSVRVLFRPTRREVVLGSLTITSALAGSTSVVLAGQGIIDAVLESEPEINFGRVFTNAPTTRTLLVRNAGDTPLPPPTLELTGSSAATVSAFSAASSCMQALGPGEQCEISIRFAPAQAVPHSANLRLASEPGGTLTVLLLAEALAPGSLVLSTQDGSADFGDVPIGTNRTREFTLTNPGNTPSGGLTIRTDSNRFEIVSGDCAAIDPAGLVNGSSCRFSVRFAPDSSLQAFANLSVQSPEAGQTGLELRGRGRSVATLTATGNRNLGRANIGQSTLTQPENQFTWTVSNDGDLASGVLAISNDNPTEFERSNDSCNNAQLAGHSSCQMTLRFRPSGAGTRAGNVVVTDPANNRSTRLALTGVGVQLAGLGQSCVNATCSAGVCTRGVCCDRACDGSCQACSTAGVCVDQSGREPCGNGSGRCFGVNRCLLPEGQACGQGSDCGLGNCERRLGGSGPNDRICCAGDCDATGQQCNAQGQCQLPSLGAGALCGRAGDAQCGGGLQCKRCLDGASRCAQPGECCGGCPAGSPVCDTSAGGVCRQCLQPTDCAPGPTGTRRQCNNNTCSYACDTQQGLKDCGNLRCIPEASCCGDSECGPCERCNGGACGALGAGQADRCPGAQEVCDNQRRCIDQRALGQSCGQPNQQCTQGSCVDSRCCPGICVTGCRSDGTCDCPIGRTFEDDSCRLSNGATCVVPSDCFNDACTRWYSDFDLDGFGSVQLIIDRCGTEVPLGGPIAGRSFVQNDDDCCDNDPNAQTCAECGL